MILRNDVFGNLTDKEYYVLSMWLKNLENGAKTPEDLLQDNYSWQNVSDLSELTKLPKESISGIISSLQDKNIIVVEDNNLFYIDEDYIANLPMWLKFEEM